MSYRMPRRHYADIYGPTTGDRVRLADTDLVAQVERAIVGHARGLPHAVAQHFAAAELALVAVHGRVRFHLGDETGIAQANAIAGGWTVDIRVVTPAD